MSRSNSGAVIHRNVAVVACDSAVTLKETLQRLDELNVSIVQVGERHLVLPASSVRDVLQRLKEHGQFPRLVGDVLEELGTETEAEEAEE